MNSEDLHDAFEKHTDEFLKHDRIENPKHERPDLCAFLMLAELFPGNRDIVAGASHDEIYLDIDDEEFAEKATDDLIRDLHRCGVRHDDDGGLCMFV